MRVGVPKCLRCLNIDACHSCIAHAEGIHGIVVAGQRIPLKRLVEMHHRRKVHWCRCEVLGEARGCGVKYCCRSI